MQNRIVSILVVMLLIMTVVSAIGSESINKNNVEDHPALKDTDIIVENGTEYWALLIVVGEYAGSPEQWTDWFRELDHMYEMLLDSGWWSEDHIKVIKGRDATATNIIQGFRWLDQMDDDDDISLVYIATHGDSLPFDIPPYDEADGSDEVLATFWGFAYPSTLIWDDELNLLLNLLDSQGVCVIVDSCHSGGFNDPPYWNRETMKNAHHYSNEGKSFDPPKAWNDGLAEDIGGQGRVVLMSCREEELSSGTDFIHYLIEGLMGFGDANMDGICSAEEAFNYMESRTGGWQHPTIYDGYPGELPLTGASKESISVDTYCRKWKENNRELESGKNVLVLPPPENSVVCGYITDASNGEPIENAKAVIYWYSDPSHGVEKIDYTDSDGFYSISGTAGHITLFFTAEGYFMEPVFLFHEIGENETLWVNRSLKRHPPETSMVCGYITSAVTHKPVENASVSTEWNLTYCDSSGFYLCNVAAGEISIFVEKNGYSRDWTYRMDVRENETVWINLSLFPEQIKTRIDKPLKALYVNNRIVMPFSTPVIIGKMDVEVSASDYWNGIDRVELYIDNELQATITSWPYRWIWDSIAFGKKTLRVAAYNDLGNTASDELTLWKFF